MKFVPEGWGRRRRGFERRGAAGWRVWQARGPVGKGAERRPAEREEGGEASVTAGEEEEGRD